MGRNWPKLRVGALKTWGVEDMAWEPGRGGPPRIKTCGGNRGARTSVAARETGPGPPVELADVQAEVVVDVGPAGSLKENLSAAMQAVRSQGTGHDQCESNGATPLKASHPTQGLISD